MLSIVELFLIALGLSMDAFAVSITNGMCMKKLKGEQLLSIPLAFGFFQGLMPVLGFLLGSTFSRYISAIDHWIALVLLSFIGGKMLWESIKELRYPQTECKTVTFTFRLVLVQAVATSIDALAVGVSFAALNINIVIAALFIAIVTFVCSFIAIFFGKRFGGLLGNKAEIFGGIILIGIGVKIFIEHVLENGLF